MNLRFVGPLGVVVFLLSACSAQVNDQKTSENPPPSLNPQAQSACTGGCGPLQVCDAERRVCVDACGGACAEEQVCRLNDEGAPACADPVVTCGSVSCEPGQTACVNGECSCLTFAQAAQDTCAAVGKVCRAGKCEAPGLYEACTDTCQQGLVCSEALGFCVRSCSPVLDTCAGAEVCVPLPEGSRCVVPTVVGAVRAKYACHDVPPGEEATTVDVGAVCRLFDKSWAVMFGLLQNGGAAAHAKFKEETSTGTCDQVPLRLADREIAISYCRPAGQVAEFGACRPSAVPMDLTSACAQGLFCLPTGGESGMCVRGCNAAGATDSCGSGAACVNVFRRTDAGDGIAGVCLATCDALSDSACGPMGQVQTSCVPTNPAGSVILSESGEGLCVPLRPDAKEAGASCSDVDPMNGAACAAGSVCIKGADQASTCRVLCDLECEGELAAGVARPPRCEMQAPRCSGERTCRPAVPGSRVGLCE